MALPPPYLAGPARFDVGLKPINPAHWLVPDDEAAWLPGKAWLIDHHADDVCRTLEGSEGAQAELLEQICAHLGCAPPSVEAPAILNASRLVSDDLVLLEEAQGSGGWQVTAACLCSPTFFDASHATGGTLGFLHEPVPGGDPQLAGRIGRVFSMIRPGQVLERHNWTVQWGPERYTPGGEPLRAAAAVAPVNDAALMLHERVERQTVSKLPQTGAVVFTIRVRLVPLVQRLADPVLRAAFEQAWYQSGPEVRTYKRWEPLERHVAYLLET